MTDPTRPAAPATGYPTHPTNGYPPPPPPQQPNYYYPNYNQQPYNGYQPPPQRACFRRLISAVIAAFVIFGLILFIVWLVLRPRVPIFTLDTLTLSSLNTTAAPSPQISATWAAGFTVVNPNGKLHVYYDQIIARLYYKDRFLTQNELPPFDQPTKNQTNFKAKLVASSAYFPSDVAQKFTADRSKGSVKFDLQMLAVVRFVRGGWTARRRYLRVLCDGVPLSVTANSSDGTLTGGSKRCAVII